MAVNKVDAKSNLKLITLYREAVHKNEKESIDKSQCRQLTLTMDYFDALEVKSFSVKENHIRAFLGQDIDEELNYYDVAMHSIPIYCPYNEFTSSIAENNPYYGEPFSIKDGAGYLCLIQVYITPEVLRRLDIYKDKKRIELGAASEVYDLFFRDIHTAMNEYTTNCLNGVIEAGSNKGENKPFSYCIYQSLSIGDYLIAIRCWSLDHVFRIMEAIRRRKLVNINGNDMKIDKGDPRSLILYKTYTIVSINEMVISEETDVAKTLGSGNRFVLRAVLSNHYWNDEKAIEKIYPPDLYLYSSEFKRLHGRYNFSVDLSESAFLFLLPTIEKYKLNHKVIRNRTINPSKREEQICDFLRYLIEQGYISQLNERYVASSEFRKDNKVEKIVEEVEPFCKLKNKSGYFNRVIKNEMNALIERINVMTEKVKKLDTSRSTITYNMILLNRMINTCITINGYSDSRVYVVIIIRLIHATLNGIEEFLNYFDRTDDYGIIKYLDSELNSAVVDLNGFSNYILDNSLESLQAPDYNLESHISVEKLMMSYSGFLQRVIDWYGNTEFSKKIDGLQERYVAIMVPKTEDNGLSIKAYFYCQDERIQEKKEKLLVVHCPSFYALTDFAGSLGRLFHELAHNLRYENRDKRNEMIVSYSAGLLLNQLVVDLVERIRTEIDTLRDAVSIQNLLESCFKDSFVDYIKKSVPNYQTLKLLNLIDIIKKCYLEMIDAVLYLETLKRHINQFVRSSDNSIFSKEEVEALWDFYVRFFGENSVLWEEIEEEGDDKAEELVQKQVAARNILITKLTERLFEFGKPIEENRDKKDAYGLLDVLSSGFPDEYTDEYKDEYPEENKEENKEENIHTREKEFYTICMRTASFIKRVTRRVTETVNNYQETSDGRKIARYFAMGYYFISDDASIDFIEFAKNSLLRTRAESIGFLDDNLFMYREIASDLYMVKMLGLTPFGYLNFCTKYIPADGMMNRQFVSRIVMTIYAMNGGDSISEKGKQYLRWQAVFPEMCQYIKGVIRKILTKPETVKPMEAHLIDFANRMDHYAKLPIKTRDKMQYLANIWSLNLKGICTRLTEEPVIQELMHCVFLCRNFMQIADFYGTSVGGSEWAEELVKDLTDGCKALDALHKEFKKSPLWDYCHWIQAVFNEPYGENEVISKGLPMLNVTKFVLDMHYDMLFNSIDKFPDRQ